jgi:hypothetical protein
MIVDEGSGMYYFMILAARNAERLVAVEVHEIIVDR